MDKKDVLLSFSQDEVYFIYRHFNTLYDELKNYILELAHDSDDPDCCDEDLSTCFSELREVTLMRDKLFRFLVSVGYRDLKEEDAF